MGYTKQVGIANCCTTREPGLYKIANQTSAMKAHNSLVMEEAIYYSEAKIRKNYLFEKEGQANYVRKAQCSAYGHPNKEQEF